MSLLEQQRALQGAILGSAASGVSPPNGLEVYRQAVPARLVDALRDNHLVLHRAMGDEAFDALAEAYLQFHPSRTRSIRWFGAQLGSFMDAWPALSHPALADMARMDWALRDAFDAADVTPLQALAGLDAETRLRLHPGVRLVRLNWAVEPAWRALRLAITEELADPELPEPEAREHTLLAWRLGLDVRWRSLEAPEAALLAQLQQGASFAQLGQCAAAEVGVDVAPTLLVQALQTWLADGLLQA
ncbi:MAG: putative DNA-binding domain-containing protein [Paucibacter sp.]|nr:putative DNA-binding domain-containing protein [Roseateles sp.]